LQFRKAFSLAFDYNTYINDVSNGFATRLEGLIPKGLVGHQDDLIEKGYIPQYDIDASKALFEELGWRGSITLAYNTASSARKALASLLKNSIEGMNIGINIVVKNSCWATYCNLPNNRVPIFILGWSPDFADPDNYMTPFIHSTKGYYSARIDYKNPNIDPMLAAASSEIDLAVRNQMYGFLERYIAEENIFMYFSQDEKINTIWYQWNGFEDSGSRNPMRNFKQVHFMHKEPQSKIIINNNFSTQTILYSQIGMNNQNIIFSLFEEENIINIVSIFLLGSSSFVAYNFISFFRTKNLEEGILKKKLKKNAEINIPEKKSNYFQDEILSNIEDLIDEFSKKDK
jgi:hypothetical protein